MSEHSIACVGVTDVVSDYLDGTLDSRRIVTVELHAVFCPGCRVFIRQMRDTVQRLRRLPDVPIDAAERDFDVAAFRNSR